MIHFVVNNDYQYVEASRIALDLQDAGFQVSLISIPHTLTVALDRTLFSRVVEISSPAKFKWAKAWIRYLPASFLVRRRFAPGPQDTIIIFTELELMNQIVALWFKKSGAKIYLMEDGGAGTYIPLALPRADPFSLKDRIKQTMIRLIPTLQQTRFTKFSETLIPLLEDKVLDGILLYRSLQTNRSVPIHVVSRPNQNKIDVCHGKAIFLNQPLYIDRIQTPEDYAIGLRKILSALREGFDEVLFKFHPRETEPARNMISDSILKDFPEIQVVNERQPFEIMLAFVRPEAVVSYHSTPLLNLKGTGVQPIFVYHLIEDLKDQSAFVAMHALLTSWDYRFPARWEDVASGFDSGSKFDDAGEAIPLCKIL
ncbi:polysialyltransferase family glycosyltransferase [Loktanella salsilacus]|jgi:hypothetical protein|uniref:polysialyltransferase family glycosyltransferase n=1 Tax=Loktanella salsilacus TaxID=195913 RepID=UPI003989B43D